ncbi:uncharacterized protein LAESUDRAFT_729108 [Laetiporus sulphureus 93-53]|uniref:NAD-P-binding protein n=1 Tax=Laetiporus sulphureus 93-53 TaxID=1314785 RepID=A0A165CVR2_9APHY|nr:uncharacterized protein LAESUDRAFT_729108 [Laetiporus sulphureus 93-53]KZT03520.1 hypothetical protein LAESUDRAFT_729108 [Laetiporus sulphureus 93-53]
MAKKNAIIFGGLNTCSRALAAYLVPPDGDSLVGNLCIVDKYSVSPPTTYLGAEFTKVLAKPNVTYRQANLTIPSAVHACFDPPEGQEPYAYVFDLTGEIQWDRPEAVQINNTLRVARHIGTEAARRGVAAYVRMMLPFYECKEKGTHDEKEDVKPDGVLGTWWHETLRTLGAIDGLNLVIVRKALVYGPYIDYGPIMTYITMGAVYGYLKQPLKALWSPGKHPTHTIHATDVAGAFWACAEWMDRVGGRKEADALAGEELPFKNDKSKADIDGVIAPDMKVVAPLFNLEDDGQLQMVDLGNRIASAFGTTFEFFNLMTNLAAKFKLEDVVEDINEEHVSTWTKMITESNPPVPNTHFTAYTDVYNLRRHVVAFNNAKLKRIVGYEIKRPQFDEKAVLELVDKLKAEGSWPNIES